MKVLLLAGGDSSEREVSLSSSVAIWQALERLGHDVVCLDPSTGGYLKLAGNKLLANAHEQFDDATAGLLPMAAKAFDVGSNMEMQNTDIVFLGLHGGMGENGSIQNLLDLAGMAYTGSNTTASVVAMDKAVSKYLMRAVGVATAEFFLARVTGETDVETLVDTLDRQFTYPVIVKPNDGGSTVGLTRVTSKEQLAPAIAKAAEETRAVLIERFVAGHELTVAVLDGQALPVVEIRPKSGLYDYEAKYTKGKTEYLAPAPIDDTIAEAVQEAAMKVYSVVGAAGLARVDFILQENGEFFCLELNTLPGMTELSLSPMAARAAGISFDQLVERVIAAGLRMRQERWKN